MAEDNRFTNREIQLMFKNIENILKQISDDIKDNNAFSEKRFQQIEKEVSLIRSEVEELKTFKTRTLAYWGVGLTAITIGINKFL